MSELSRRQFIADGGKLAAGAAIIPANRMQRDIFIHHVYFWLQDPASVKDRDLLVEGLRKLSKVKSIQSFHIGKPADTDRDVIDRSYAVSWMLIFANKADQDSYQTDPIHLQFIETCKHLWKKVVVYDSVDV